MHSNVDIIERLANLLRAERRATAALPDIQTKLLRYLAAANRYSDTLTAATDYLAVTKGSLSASVTSLVRGKYLKRRIDQIDERTVHLELTPKGLSLLKSFSNGAIERIVAGFSALDGIDEAKHFEPYNVLVGLLTAVQKRTGNQMFGVCSTCRFFRKRGLGNTHQCGLTLEPLSVEDSKKLCREHEYRSRRTC